ncbi:putative Na+/H+ antiporter [Viridibacterium curvum]|uniref:Na+/H+ antiporter n=1 Tax=Viridibacterium curvum TaxID=1101404 RepID=A0ABP9QC04_9RHOO
MTQPIELIATALFALAILHTFLTSQFERLAHRDSAHSGLWHFFGEVEVVFGIWAGLLLLSMGALQGGDAAVNYLEGLNFTEPMFVFAIMVIAASRPILDLCAAAVRLFARILPVHENLGIFFALMGLVPLLGSLITEPAAMTLAALMLRDRFYKSGIPDRLAYATLGVLFVNISIGGTMTSFAAPPVLMVAGAWQWDSSFMFNTFGWKAALAVLVNALALTVWFRKALTLTVPVAGASDDARRVPWLLTLLHLLMLAGVVFYAHHPVVFMAIFLLFLGLADAYAQFHQRIILREGLLVAFFLAGLVVLGALQRWWLQPVLSDMPDAALFFGALGLTAVTDNAALTYLGSLVEGVSDGFKYALVAGAVTGGGLTVIANAPNPAAFAILKEHFRDKTISPVGLFLAALLPTLVATLAFLLL